MRSVSTKRRALLLALLIILSITPLSADGDPPFSPPLDARIKPPIGCHEIELDPTLLDMIIVWWQLNVISPLG